MALDMGFLRCLCVFDLNYFKRSAYALVPSICAKRKILRLTVLRHSYPAEFEDNGEGLLFCVGILPSVAS